MSASRVRIVVLVCLGLALAAGLVTWQYTHRTGPRERETSAVEVIPASPPPEPPDANVEQPVEVPVEPLPRRLGAITGQVWDARGNKPIQGAAVTTEPATAQATTDEAGKFSIAPVEPGRAYTAIARGQGFEERRVNVKVGEAAADLGRVPMQALTPASHLVRGEVVLRPDGALDLKLGRLVPSPSHKEGSDIRLRTVQGNAGRVRVEGLNGAVLARCHADRLQAIRRAPEHGYVGALERAVGDCFFVRDRRDYFAKCRVRRLGGGNGLALAFVLQTNGTRVFPAGPAGLSAVRRFQGVGLTWREGAGHAARYRMYRRSWEEPERRIGETAATDFSDNGTARFGLYTYGVSAVDAAGNESDTVEVNAYAGPAGVRMGDAVLSPKGAYDIVRARAGGSRADLRVEASDPATATVQVGAGPGGGVLSIGLRPLAGLAVAPADGYTSSTSLEVGHSFWLRTGDGRYAKCRVRRVDPDGTVAVSYLLQPDGRRTFATGPAEVRAESASPGVLIRWRRPADPRLKFRVYRRGDFTHAWERLYELYEPPYLDVPPESQTTYEYGVAAQDDLQGASDLCVAQTYAGPIPAWLRRGGFAGNALSVLAMYPSAQAHPTGLAFDKTTLWSCEARSRFLFRHRLSDIAVVSRHSIGRDVTLCGLAWDGSRLWCCERGGPRLFRLDENGRIEKTIHIKGARLCAVAWDFRYVWVGGLARGQGEGAPLAPTLYQVTRRGALCGERRLPLAPEPFRMTWDGRSFWIAQDARLMKFDRDFALVKEFDASVQNASGLAWDGVRLWVADEAGGKIYKYIR